MKKLLIPLLFFCIQSFGQRYQPIGSPFGNDMQRVNAIKTLYAPKFSSPSLNGGLDSAGALGLNTTDSNFYGYDGVTWKLLGNGSDTLLAGGAFTTSNVQIGFNPGTNINAAKLLAQVFYGTQPPTATLTGGTTLELTNASTVSQTLNWGAGRGSNTPILTSIVVAGTTQSFAQPAQSGTVLGTQAVSVPANVTTVYSNVVTASDAQTATATTTFTFSGKKYYGLISDTTGIGSGTQDAAILALTSAFASSKTLSVNTGSITGTKFWVYVYPASLGSLSALSFNSIPALEAMNTATRNFTNALGYTQSYILYWNKQGQTISSDISAQ